LELAASVAPRGKIAGWKGRMVVVRYSPHKHDLSVLSRGDQPGGQLGN
jgi:hypothetical protein